MCPYIIKDKPRVHKISEIVKETHKVKTYKFFDEHLALSAKPGQFLMLWIPGVDEIPISISNVDRTTFEVWITVARVGDATSILDTLKKGDEIGVRGPYGTAFTIDDYRRILIIGGGYGIAPLAFLAEEAHKSGKLLDVIIGAKTKEDLFFVDRFKKVAKTLLISTDDGSFGVKGFTTDLYISFLKSASTKPDVVLTCGPEKMMAKVYLISKKYEIPVQASLERYMKCGIGICGSCALGPYRVCIDGPVFTSNMLKKVSNELGKLKRDSASAPIPV
ncbi:MAG: dihydroorotate dehydrogenase electron transfer subunit [Candidatus Odinarchaeota archaeon]|nr:dihydroorotate dehydrogenase electron transfer subunit [Candidatus Odinarchaeota archaeon]